MIRITVLIEANGLKDSKMVIKCNRGYWHPNPNNQERDKGQVIERLGKN